MLNKTLNKVSNHSKPNWLRDKPVLIMEKCFLTNGGNLLRFHPDLNKYYFQKPNGFLFREVFNEEASYIVKNSLEMDLHHPPAHPTSLDFLEVQNYNTVKILEELGIDYFSHQKEGSDVKNLYDTEYARIHNVWASINGNGADLRVELGRRKDQTIVVCVLDVSGEETILEEVFPFTPEGIDQAISHMYSLCD